MPLKLRCATYFHIYLFIKLLTKRGFNVVQVDVELSRAENGLDFLIALLPLPTSCDYRCAPRETVFDCILSQQPHQLSYSPCPLLHCSGEGLEVISEHRVFFVFVCFRYWDAIIPT